LFDGAIDVIGAARSDDDLRSVVECELRYGEADAGTAADDDDASIAKGLCRHDELL
jgi:hypothetical protein